MRVVPSPSGLAKIKAVGLKFRAEITQEVADDAQRNAPVDTGELRSSITAIPELGIVTVGTDHWAPQEYGARPHRIEPDTKEALSWPGGAHPVAYVNHPGNRAQPFMRPAVYKKRRG